MIATFVIIGSAAIAAVLCLLIEYMPAFGEPLAIAVLIGVGILRTCIVGPAEAYGTS
jgi:hypothetical protein